MARLVVSAALSSHPDVDMMSFTGSTRAGVLVAQNAAPSVKRVAQELGGKSANIILADADFETAVKDGASDVFDNTGQSCDAPSRMLVPRDRMDEAAALAASVAEGLRTFHGTLEGQHLGISGVNMDEEAVSLMAHQRAYQASARVISTINQLMDVLVNL